MRAPSAQKTWMLSGSKNYVVQIKYIQVSHLNRYVVITLDKQEISTVPRSLFNKAEFLFEDMLGAEFIFNFKKKMDTYDKFLDSK